VTKARLEQWLHETRSFSFAAASGAASGLPGLPGGHARGHVRGTGDGLTVPVPFLDDAQAWKKQLRGGMPDEEAAALRERTRTGRPLGTAGFLDRLERTLGRVLKPGKPGRKPTLPSPIRHGRRGKSKA